MAGGTRDLAENTFLMVVARLAMVGATVALPVVGWLLVRGINGVDEIGRKVDIIHDRVLETSSTMRLIQQQQANEATILSDHEGRIRLLERMSKQPIPAPPIP